MGPLIIRENRIYKNRFRLSIGPNQTKLDIFKATGSMEIAKKAGLLYFDYFSFNQFRLSFCPNVWGGLAHK